MDIFWEPHTPNFPVLVCNLEYSRTKQKTSCIFWKKSILTAGSALTLSGPSAVPRYMTRPTAKNAVNTCRAVQLRPWGANREEICSSLLGLVKAFARDSLRCVLSESASTEETLLVLKSQFFHQCSSHGICEPVFLWHGSVTLLLVIWIPYQPL